MSSPWTHRYVSTACAHALGEDRRELHQACRNTCKHAHGAPEYCACSCHGDAGTQPATGSPVDQARDLAMAARTFPAVGHPAARGVSEDDEHEAGMRDRALHEVVSEMHQRGWDPPRVTVQGEAGMYSDHLVIVERAPMDDLLAFVRARLDEDERTALSIDELDGDQVEGIAVYTESNYPCGHVLAIGRKRALADVEAKRRIIDQHGCVESPEGWACRRCSDMSSNQGRARWSQFVLAPCPTIRLLAAPYADREAYKEAWRP